MAQTTNRLFDDIARLMTDAAGAADGVRREVETVVKSQIERLLREMDVARREEVDVLRDMVVAAREENEQLALRVKRSRAGSMPEPLRAVPLLRERPERRAPARVGAPLWTDRPGSLPPAVEFHDREGASNRRSHAGYSRGNN